MTFTAAVTGTCSGGNHVHLTITIGGVPRTFEVTRDDLQVDYTFEEAKDAVLARLRSAVKEANASTPLQIKNAIEAGPFKI